MCGIIGYTGNNNAKEIILKGLTALEYRGYDSSGLAIFKNNEIITVKATGRVSELIQAATDLPSNLNCGIGHTRWATHGEPTSTNAHPHGTKNIQLVHNGIIENFSSLKTMLIEKGYTFDSETDTEVAAKLIDYEYTKTKEPIKAISSAIGTLSGSFALGIIFKDHPARVFCAKKDSPLLLGRSKNGNYIASDITAFIEYTNEFIRMNDCEIAEITNSDIILFNKEGKIITQKWEVFTPQSTDGGKQGFSHYMLKEIHDEPQAITDTLNSIAKNDLPSFPHEITELIKNTKRIHITACGTAYHAALTGKHFIEKYARIPVSVTTASELRYTNPIIMPDDLLIAISQSGETADTLACMRILKGKMPILAIVNTYGSTISHEADFTIHTKGGKEIAVASTKAFTVQMLTLQIFALQAALSKGKTTKNDVQATISSIRKAANTALVDVINLYTNNIPAAHICAKSKDIFFIGRGFDSILATEGSLKLKEISYIHSEAYPAGELKHGTISLIENGTPVIAIATDSSCYAKIFGNIQEVKSRGATVIAVCPEDAVQITDFADYVINLPCNKYAVYPYTAAAALQLLAFNTAKIMKKDIDKPRNLAKSVTVE